MYFLSNAHIEVNMGRANPTQLGSRPLEDRVVVCYVGLSRSRNLIPGLIRHKPAYMACGPAREPKAPSLDFFLV